MPLATHDAGNVWPNNSDRPALDRMSGEQALDRGDDRGRAASPGIDRSLVPKAIVVTASITCDEAEEQNERQHFRILGAQQPRNQQVIERQPGNHEDDECDDDGRNRIDSKQREQPERQKRAQHQKVAMRQIDDAHDAEHEVEAKPDQRKIEAEQQAGRQAIRKHTARSAGLGFGSLPGSPRSRPRIDRLSGRDLVGPHRDEL